MDQNARPLALVTGASTGIGYELAKCCAQNGFDLVIAADEARIEEAARELRGLGATVEAVEADLASTDGVDKLYGVAQRLGRPVEALLANAGRGLGKALLDQDFAEIMRVVNTNVTGTLYLIHHDGHEARHDQKGRSRRGRPAGLRCDDARRRRDHHRMAEQVAGGDRPPVAARHARRDASPPGAAGHGGAVAGRRWGRKALPPYSAPAGRRVGERRIPLSLPHLIPNPGNCCLYKAKQVRQVSHPYLMEAIAGFGVN